MGVPTTARIGIIGAGPAGLATAHRLRQRGFESVTVLEKSPDIGGLCLTYEFEGRAFDLGANYVTSSYRRILQMAEEVGAKLYVETDASFFDTGSRRYQSIFRTARGSTSLLKFGYDSVRYLWKRHRLDDQLPATGYASVDSRKDLVCTFAEWLRAEGLEDLSTLFEIPITLMGYGGLDEIPAPYALTYMNVRTVIDLMIFGSLPFHRWPRRFVNGFQRFWERIAEPLDVRTDVRIESVKRTADGVTVTAGFPTRVGDRIEHHEETVQFDWLVLCCPLQTEVTSQFLDLTDPERDLFDRITLNPFCVTTFELRGGGKGLPTRLVNVTPVPARASARPTILTQQFGNNPLVTFYTPVSGDGEHVRDAVIEGVRDFAAELGIELGDEPVTWDSFPYFPHVGVEEIRRGWYRELEGMQGGNRTFYNGGVMAFELVEPIVEYSEALVDRFLVGRSTHPLAPADEPAVGRIESDPLTRRGLRSGFADLMEEADATLEVEGHIPEWADGALVRNGPARWEMTDGRLNHWFDGVAMLHRFGVRNGAVHYRNRWLRSRNYEATVRTGRNQYAQFGTDPKRTWLGKLAASIDFSLQIGNNDFITVGRLGSEWIAVGETPTQIAIDVEDLTTKGVFRFADRLLAMWTCSHMLPDPGTNRIYNYSILALPFFSRYRVWHADADDHTRTVLASLPDASPSYMHSFGLSEHYVVLTQFPLKLDALKLFTSGFTGTPILRCMRWHDGIPTRTVVLDKETGAVVTTVELPPMFAFHHLNAWEEGGDLVFDIATYETSAPERHMYFDTLFGPHGGDVPYSSVNRFRVPLDGSPPPPPVRVSDAAFEMPRINEARIAQAYRFAYGQTWSERGRWYDRLAKIDTHGDPATNATVWGQDGWYPSEPVFVARPDGEDEDDGVVLSVVLDATRDEPSSFLVVLDGRTFTELARARVPHHIPFGLHGQFVRAEGR